MSERWAAELADTLGATARRLERLVDAVATDWPDRYGGAWTERAAQLHRELSRQLVAAVELGERITPGAVAPRSGTAGVRLADTTGRRIDEDRGPAIPELPPP